MFENVSNPPASRAQSYRSEPSRVCEEQTNMSIQNAELYCDYLSSVDLL